MEGECKTTSEKIANNASITAVARLAMIAASVALPILVGAAGWVITRSVDAIDKVTITIDGIKDRTLETNGNVKLIQQSLSIQGALLADHETRMRILERTVQRPNPNP